MNDFLGTYFFFLTFIVFLLIALASEIVFHFKKRRVDREERREDVMNSGIERPQPFRPLSGGEKQVLGRKDKFPRWVLHNRFWIIAAFIIMDLVLLATDVFAPFIIFALAIEIYLLFKAHLATEYSLDFVSPIFRVQGQALKKIIKSRYSTYYYLTVREVTFSNKEYPQLPNFLFHINEEQEVSVEYSPHTKHVWKMYKI